jgi:hypothetical protein
MTFCFMAARSNKISCFPFENYLQKLKKLIKLISSSNNPVAQIAKRMAEMESIAADNFDCSLDIQTNGLQVQMPDNCYLMYNGNTCFLHAVLQHDMLEVQILHRSHLRNWFSLPCESSHINIWCEKNGLETNEVENCKI